MQSKDLKQLFTNPWAYAPDNDTINDIPDRYGQRGRASLEKGFALENQTPLAEGGIPPYGSDMNGILRMITTASRNYESGKLFPWSQDYANAIGGYPSGAVAMDPDHIGNLFVSLVDDNNDNPAANTGKWRNILFNTASTDWVNGNFVRLNYDGTQTINSFLNINGVVTVMDHGVNFISRNGTANGDGWIVGNGLYLQVGNSKGWFYLQQGPDGHSQLVLSVASGDAHSVYYLLGDNGTFQVPKINTGDVQTDTVHTTGTIFANGDIVSGGDLRGANVDIGNVNATGNVYCNEAHSSQVFTNNVNTGDFGIGGTNGLGNDPNLFMFTPQITGDARDAHLGIAYAGKGDSANVGLANRVLCQFNMDRSKWANGDPNLPANDGFANSGEMSVHVQLNVSGDSIFFRSCRVNKNLDVGGAFSATGNTVFQQNLTVNGMGLFGGRVTFNGGTLGANGDIAENYKADRRDYRPGQVMMFSSQPDAEVTLCTAPHEAFGVYSTSPQHLMNYDPGTQDGYYIPIALKGRVPVLVEGRIRKGQRIMATARGTAIAWDGSQTPVIGRALESRNAEETGLVECFVSAMA